MNFLPCGCFSDYYGNEHLHDRVGNKRYFLPPVIPEDNFFIVNGQEVLPDHTEVSYNCFIHLCYLSERLRFSEERVKRLIRADKEIPEFDWSSVARGEEDEELKKYGI